MIAFNDPWILLLIPIIWIVSLALGRKKKSPGIRFSAVSLFNGLNPSVKSFLSSNIIFFRLIALTLIVLALARPQTPVEDSFKRTEGIDIILTIDVSTSMLAEDFSTEKERYNRLEAVKRALPDFIDSRKSDRLGIVVFATRPFTASPLTLNHSWILKRIESLQAGKLGNRTAIGSAIATSLNRLRRSHSKSKVMILLTDGRSNAGDITPDTAADIAKALNVKIYTIGAGTFGSVPYPVLDSSGNITGYESVKIDMDEDLLRDIATTTEGRYFRVTDTDSLKKVYKEIDRLEKVYLQEKAYNEYNELFWIFLLFGLIILVGEIVLSNTFLRRIP